MNAGIATKRPIPIDWFEWKDQNYQELNQWLNRFDEELENHPSFTLNSHYDLKIETLEGSSYKVPNNYIIIRGIQGEFYPCDPEIFRTSYNAKLVS